MEKEFIKSEQFIPQPRKKILEKLNEKLVVNLLSTDKVFHYTVKTFEMQDESKNPKYLWKSFKMDTDSEEDATELMRNVEGLKDLAKDNQHILKPVSIEPWRDEKHKHIYVEIVYEYGGKNILELYRQGALSVRDLFAIADQTADTLNYAQSQQKFHLDLKPENIFFEKGVARIFGFIGESSKLYPKLKYYYKHIPEGGNVWKTFYYPPEQLPYPIEKAAMNYNMSKIDVYMWGMTFYQLLAKKEVESLAAKWEETKRGSEGYEKFLDGIDMVKLKEIPSPVARNIVRLLRSCLSNSPLSRYSFKEILEDWMDDILSGISRESEHSLLSVQLSPKAQRILEEKKFQSDEPKIRGAEETKVSKHVSLLNIPEQKVDEAPGNPAKNVLLQFALSKGKILKEDKFGYSTNQYCDKYLKSKKGKVFFSRLKLRESDARAIAFAIKTSNYVKVIHLENNNIRDEGARAIADALKTNQFVTELYLANNNIYEKGSVAICRALETNRALLKLDLSQNYIEGMGIRKLSYVLRENNTLEYLDLSRNQLKQEGSDYIFSGLAGSKSLKALDVGQNKIGNGGCEGMAIALKKNSSLEELCLADNQLQTDGILSIFEAIEQSKTIKKIFLQKNEMLDSKLEKISVCLEKNTSLEEINFDLNGLTKDGPFLLFGSPTDIQPCCLSMKIKAFSCAFNVIGEEGLECIVAMLEKNVFATDLCLESSRIYNVECLANSIREKKIKSLVNIDLSGNRLRVEGLKILLGALSSKEKSSIISLMVNNDNLSGDLKDITGVLKMCGLQKLSLCHCYITDIGCKGLGAGLNGNTCLKELRLDGNKFKTAGAIEIALGLTNTKALAVFSLNKGGIKDEGAQKIVDALKDKELLTLELRANEISNKDNYIGKAMENHTKLACLDLGDSPILEDTIEDLAKSLIKIKTLAKLSLSNCRIGKPKEENSKPAEYPTKGGKAVGDLIQYHENLKEFKVTDNYFEKADLSALTVALAKNTTLEFFDVSALNYSKTDIEDLGRYFRDGLHLLY